MSFYPSITETTIEELNTLFSGHAQNKRISSKDLRNRISSRLNSKKAEINELDASECKKVSKLATDLSEGFDKSMEYLAMDKAQNYKFYGANVLRDLVLDINQQLKEGYYNGFAFAYDNSSRYSNIPNELMFFGIFDAKVLKNTENIQVDILKSSRSHTIDLRIINDFLIISALLHTNYHKTFFQIYVNPGKRHFDVAVSRKSKEITLTDKPNPKEPAKDVIRRIRVNIEPSDNRFAKRHFCEINHFDGPQL